jgi:RHS repeat-associated protein
MVQRRDFYDAKNLATYKESAGDATPEEIAYTYDSAGRVTDVVLKDGTATELEYAYGYTDGRLMSFNNGTYYTFSYDGMGNPTTYKNSSLSWTRGRMLKSGTQKGNSFEYKYDAENLRYEKTVNGVTTRYYYNAGQLQAEERGDEFIYYLYGIEGITGMIYNGQYYFYKKNVLGDVTEIYNSNGSEVATYDYDAWGNVINKSGTMADVNPIRYRGYYYDSETGFYYLNTRYYDPEIRRFVNADNYELLPELAGVYGQVNLYNYCNNNPVMYTDPTGEFWKEFGGWIATARTKS